MSKPQELNKRRITTTLRGKEIATIQVRLRQSQEPDLYEFITGIEAGSASHFIRSALDQAYRMGALTPSGLALKSDDAMRSLQVQLEMQRHDKIALEERVRVLTKLVEDLREQLDVRGAPPVPGDGTSNKVIPQAFAAAMRDGQTD